MMIRWYTKRALHFSKRTAMALLWFPSAPQVVRTRNSHGSFTTVMVGLSVQMVGNRDTTKNMSVILITSPRAQHQPSTSVGPWIISSLQYFQSLNSITQGPIINHHPLCSAINHSQPFSTILHLISSTHPWIIPILKHIIPSPIKSIIPSPGGAELLQLLSQQFESHHRCARRYREALGLRGGLGRRFGTQRAGASHGHLVKPKGAGVLE